MLHAEKSQAGHNDWEVDILYEGNVALMSRTSVVFGASGWMPINAVPFCYFLLISPVLQYCCSPPAFVPSAEVTRRNGGGGVQRQSSHTSPPPPQFQFLGEGGILGMLLDEVLKSSMRSSNSRGGYSWLPRIGYSVWFWQQNLLTPS